jgi:hypothetical protein
MYIMSRFSLFKLIVRFVSLSLPLSHSLFQLFFIKIASTQKLVEIIPANLANQRTKRWGEREERRQSQSREKR